MIIGNLSAAHAFDYIMLRVKPGLTSCEDLATALLDVIATLFLCRALLLTSATIHQKSHTFFMLN